MPLVVLAALWQADVLRATALVAVVTVLLGGLAVWRILVVARRIRELQDKLSETEVRLRRELEGRSSGSPAAGAEGTDER